jgi:8-oxo-dGTP diphosphatase
MPEFTVHVDAIVRRGDEILIMKRAMGVMTGAWYFPGGSLEVNETPEEGARREIREEAKLEVENMRIFRSWHYGASDAPSVAISFVCEVPEGTEPRINEEHVAARWVSPEYYRDRFVNDEALAAVEDNPYAYSLVGGVRRLIDAYIEEKQQGAFS